MQTRYWQIAIVDETEGRIMSLGTDQKKFTHLIGLLIVRAYQQGFQLTFGDAYRDPRVFGEFGEKEGYGSDYSFHKKRLAVDFNLFKEGAYLTETEEYRELGEYWMSLDPECSWGGDWDDGNHFSYGEK